MLGQYFQHIHFTFTWVTLLVVIFDVIGGTQVALYQKINYRGAELGVRFSASCFDLPSHWRAKAKAIRTNGPCVILHEEPNCSGPNTALRTSSPNLEQWSNRISSLSPCTQKESSTTKSTPTILSTNKPPPASPPLVSGAAGHLDAGLKVHNVLRANHDTPPLQLDQKVVNSAQKCADYLATTNQFGHICKSGGFGENLWGGWGEMAGNDSSLVDRAVREWYAEVAKYDWGKPVVNSKTGHFTQLVWAGSRGLGIGLARNAKERYVVVVAQYDPPGNHNSAAQLEANVRRPKALMRIQEEEEDSLLVTRIL